jgi:putative ABC transport system permease protein
MTSLLNDIRLALRALARRPSFTAISILTLAVAIGANTAIFSVVYNVLIRPLPYPNADRIVTMALGGSSGAGVDELPFSDRAYWFFQAQNHRLEALGGFTSQKVPLVGEGAPVQVNAGVMSRSAFDVLAVAPERGRLFTKEEDAPGGEKVIILSHDLWKSRFGGDPSIIGKSIDVNGSKRNVIGIMPASFDFPAPDIDLWVPYQLDPASPNFGGHHIQVIARLADGVSLEAAKADADHLVPRLSEVGYGPEWFTNVLSGKTNVRSYQEQLTGDVRRPLFILLGMVGFVLLIACSNVANLFLLRAESRTRETAVRIALGAGQWAILRYILVESLLLALLGGAAGILLAWLGIRVLVSMAPAAIPRLAEIHVTGSVLLFTLGVSVVAGLLFGVLPGLRAFSYRLVTVLRDGGRGATSGKGRHRARSILVVSQVALALLLLVGSGLMVRSFLALKHVDTGFRTDGIVTFQLSPPPIRYDTPEKTMQFYDQLLAAIRELPGVQSAGAITQLPLASKTGTFLAVEVQDHPTPPNDFPPTFHVRRVTPGYFETMGIPVREGRTFDARDHQQRLGTAIISQAIKDQFWPSNSPIGRKIAPSTQAFESIVGVVSDVQQLNLEDKIEPTIYLPMVDSAGGGVRSMSIAIRTAGDPLNVMSAVRDQIRRLDADLPITDVRTMDAIIGESISRTSFTAFLLIVAAGIGLFLGSIGIYGVISYVVSQRTLELGIRQALGASSGSLRLMVLRQGVGLTALGLVIGVGAALALGKVITTLLYGVKAFDPITFIGGSAVMLTIAVLACLVPAQRAATVAPSQALRAE